jgi:hypothetical protein
MQLCSQDLATLKKAEANLARIQDDPKLLSYLVQTIEAPSVSMDAKWMASRTLRSTVERIWRRSPALNGKSLEERAQLRTAVFHCISNATDVKIRTQLQVALARMARMDFPNRWPNVLEDILNYIQSFLGNLGVEPSEIGLNTLVALFQTLFMTIKSLVSIRVGPPRTLLGIASENSLSRLYPWFQTSFNLKQPELNRWMLKCIRYLLVFGVQYPNNIASVRSRINFLIWRFKIRCVEYSKAHSFSPYFVFATKFSTIVHAC